MYITCIYIKYTEDEINAHALMQLNRKETNKKPLVSASKTHSQSKEHLTYKTEMLFPEKGETF